MRFCVAVVTGLICLVLVVFSLLATGFSEGGVCFGGGSGVPADSVDTDSYFRVRGLGLSMCSGVRLLILSGIQRSGYLVL